MVLLIVQKSKQTKTSCLRGMLIATRWVLATEYKLIKEKGMTILLFVVWTIRTPLQKLLKIP